MALREVYERWQIYDDLFSSSASLKAAPRPNVVTDAALLDCWAAIRAAVEERCVWTTEGIHVNGWWNVSCTHLTHRHVDAATYVACPYCGREIERKEASHA